MKKLIAMLLLLSMALPLFGCLPDYPADTFFGAELLAEYNLSDLPVPKLENSRLGGEYLYCNLTQEEYESYVAELVAYLRGREDIYNLCYRYGRTLQFGAFPLDTCAPLPEDYDYTGDQHAFVFTYMEALGDDNRMADPIRISVIRETDTLFRTDFTYNTILQLQPSSSIPAELDYCAAEHTYDEGEVYPVPGLDRSVTIYHCIHCGSKTQSAYPVDSRKSYTVTVSEGLNYIWGNNRNHFPWGIDSMYAGLELEIICLIPEKGTLQVLVNGENIPVLRTSEDKVTFGFLMPEVDVEIEIRLITESEE